MSPFNKNLPRLLGDFEACTILYSCFKLWFECTFLSFLYYGHGLLHLKSVYTDNFQKLNLIILQTIYINKTKPNRADVIFKKYLVSHPVII